ncbi:MAG TPA: TIM barrel protein [Planctomycetaceae bacterium]|nr:TIM barrel protein [Planctomycetaceae bacterium]
MSHTAPTRREFLQAAAATAFTPLVLSAATPTSPSPSRRPWKWAPEPGLWETQCGNDVVAQLHVAADAGFAAFADPWMMRNSTAEQDDFALAASIRGIVLGPAQHCWDPFPSTNAIFDEMARIGVAWRNQSIANAFLFNRLTTSDGRRRVVQSLNRSVPRTAPIVMLVEPLVTDLAHRDWYEWFAEIVHEVNHPLCRLSVDTYRLAAAGMDVVDYLHRHASILGHVELADFPGGYEPGSGTLDIDGIIAATALSPFEGVIGLRCGLSQPSVAGLSRLIAAARRHHGLREAVLA